VIYRQPLWQTFVDRGGYPELPVPSGDIEDVTLTRQVNNAYKAFSQSQPVVGLLPADFEIEIDVADPIEAPKKLA
jgi:hypothetical protein